MSNLGINSHYWAFLLHISSGHCCKALCFCLVERATVHIRSEAYFHLNTASTDQDGGNISEQAAQWVPLKDPFNPPVWRSSCIELEAVCQTRMHPSFSPGNGLDRAQCWAAHCRSQRRTGTVGTQWRCRLLGRRNKNGTRSSSRMRCASTSAWIVERSWPTQWLAEAADEQICGQPSLHKDGTEGWYTALHPLRSLYSVHII